MTIKFMASYLTKPLYVFGWAGMLAFAISLFSALIAFLMKFAGWPHHADFIQTPLPVLAMVTLVLGIQLFLMGLIAEMVVRTYHESQGKPIYTIKTKINFEDEAEQQNVRYSGIHQYDLTRPADEQTARAMAAAIRHRGPDDEGFYFKENVAMGMRRLSIIDLSTGHQPISNEDGSVWVVFNGEIYNFPELRGGFWRAATNSARIPTLKSSSTFTRIMATTWLIILTACSRSRCGMSAAGVCSSRATGWAKSRSITRNPRTRSFSHPN